MVDGISTKDRFQSNEERVGNQVLIELAALLGDDPAGLTQPTFDIDGWYREDGYKYGRFSRLLTSTEWGEFEEKKPPTTDRFLQIFHTLAMVSVRRLDPRDEIKFDWEFVARHLREPPYEESKLYYREDEESPELQSCKEVVHELRQRDLKFAPLLQELDKFEQVAIELGVYE